MANYGLEEGQIVLCTVEKIVGTTVFVEIDNNGDGTITTSEIAPGRIRNLRDYVAPGRKIVCRVLNIRDNKIQLSLRRVKQNEKKELLDRIAKEKSYLAMLKTILGESSEKVIKKITEKYSMTDFFEFLKENPKLLEEYVDKKEAEKIFKILESKKEKPKEIKQVFKLSNSSPSGIKIIKNILEESCKSSNCDINYIAAGKYRLSLIGKDFKKLKSETHKVLENIEKLAKNQNCYFEVQKG
ncbi:MAG: hypothetical protein AABW90_01840 [Nanoarchaeota archaeon]